MKKNFNHSISAILTFVRSAVRSTKTEFVQSNTYHFTDAIEITDNDIPK